MTPRFLGQMVAVCAAAAVVVATSAASAATAAAGADASRPLGTLWYPGPYQEPPPVPAVAPPPETPPPPAPTPGPARVTVPPPALGAPEPGKPLGTLWYPGPYRPGRAVPAPVVAPPPMAPPTPVAAPEPQPTPPAPPAIGAPEPGKPLGTLWYPGPYATPKPPPRPTPTPAAASPAPPQPAAGPAATQPPTPPAAAQPAPAPAPVSAKKAPPPPAPHPTKKGTELPVHLTADEMSYDQERGLVTATGNVVIVQGKRRLRADAVTYNQATDVVSANGNISLTQPDGERMFADHMEITGDLKDATVEAIGILLTDHSRMAAAGARYYADNMTEMRKGVYSPCNLCKTDPTRPPLWQIKAVKVIHDQKTKIIEYRDAWLEVFGVPVAYTPYFSHPDPTVKRKSGLLAPSFGHSSDLGFLFKVPYFYEISPNADATVTALFSGDAGSGGLVEYRQRFMNGTLDATGSLVAGDSEKEIRGHIDAKARFDINDTWRTGVDINRASDDTYLRRYGFGSPETLNSRAFVEGFRKRNYFAVNGYAFQGMRETDVSGLEPFVLPMIDFNHVGETDRFGGETLLDVNLLTITRTAGPDTRRLSIHPGWQLPFIGPLGDAYKLSFSLNGDFYHVDDLQRQGQSDFTGFSGRLVPQVTLDWRYPFIKEGASFSHIIEPIVLVAYSPNGGNSADIPNEDSQEFEFDDTNLFSPNKFSGIDRVEGGARINYGIKWGVYGKSGGSTSFFVGQSFRPRTDDTFAAGTGLEEKFSDIVGRVKISPTRNFNLHYRTRFASDNLTLKRNEVGFNAGFPVVSVNANYLFIDTQQGSEFPAREEITYSASAPLNRFWRVAFSGVNDLAAKETRSIGAQLVFENECVILTTNAQRSFFEDRDLKPDDQITFRVVLKTLGEIRTGISP